MHRTMMSPDDNQQQFKLSKYVHHHPVGPDVIGLYTPINHEVTFVSEQVWQSLTAYSLHQVPMEIAQDLITRNFLVPPGFDRQALARYAVPPLAEFFSLYLLISGNCNMGCAYCIVDRKTDAVPCELEGKTAAKSEQMSPEVADAAIRLFARMVEIYRPAATKVTLYGGEPMLNKDLLLHVIPQLRNIRYIGQTLPIEILCFTNGLLYDEALTQFFVQNDVAVGLSLDGMAQHHDQARKSLGGQKTFDQVVTNYHRYRQAGARVGVSCTIGRHNFEHLQEIASYFVDELKVPSMQFQAPIQMTDNNNPMYVEMHKAARNALDAFKYLRARGIEEGLAMRRMHPFSQGRFHYRDCLAVGGELAVAPDGRVGPCHNAVSMGNGLSCKGLGDVDIDLASHRLFTEWHARMPLNMAGCKDCAFIALCGGGCPYNAYLTKGSIWETDPQQCGYMAELTNWLLEDIWERYHQTKQYVRY